MRKSYLSIVLIVTLALTACGTNASNATNVTSISVEDMPLSAEPADATTTQNNSIQAVNAFNPHVFSKRATTIFGEKTRDSFFKLCDALKNGEDTFECPDEETYRACIDGELLNYYFPAAASSVAIELSSGYENGVGKIKYLEDKNEFLAKEKAFEDKVIKTLNENIEPSYSEFEKALSLYVYISQNFVYDYEMYEDYLVGNGNSNNVTTYRALMENKGISQELSNLYSYLLLQCGVDADVISGFNINGDHQWSYISIGGKDYHVDPTSGLSSPDLFDDNTPLDYFLMTDNTRAERDGFPSSEYALCGRADCRQFINFEASDDKYSSLSGGYFLNLDCTRNVLTYGGYDGGGVQEFRYED